MATADRGQRRSQNSFPGVGMKIVVRIPNWLGDVIMAVPALRRLRHSVPDTTIDLIGPGWASDILSDAGLCEKFVALGDQKQTGVLATSRDLRSRKYDLGILFTNSFSSAFSMRLAGIPRRFGYATDGRGFLLTDRVAIPEQTDPKHHVFSYLNIADAVIGKVGLAAAGDDEPDMSIRVSPTFASDAERFLLNLGIDSGKPLIVLGIGSANSNAKRWGAERFARLNDLLRRDLGANVILLGSRNDHEVAARVAAAAIHDLVDLTGQTELSRAAGILDRADAVVSNDMGLGHLAAALGTRTFVIFGPTDPVTTRPYSRTAKVLTADVECSPCMLRECPIDHRCMTRVSVETVFSEVSAAVTRHK